jgi:hypothetical protein
MYTYPRTRFELSNLVVLDTDCTCCCKSNYHGHDNDAPTSEWDFPLGYMIKTLNPIFFSLHQNQNIFFSNIANRNIFFFRKKT